MSESSYLDLEMNSENNSEDNPKYLTFLSDGKFFAINIFQIIQIAGTMEIDKVPEFPEYVKGIICIRGNIIPTIDFAARIGLTPLKDDNKFCTIIMDVSDQLVAIAVDKVCDIVEIPDNKVMLPMQGLGQQIMDYFIVGVAKVNEKTTFLIDVEKTLLETDKELVFSYEETPAENKI